MSSKSEREAAVRLRDKNRKQERWFTTAITGLLMVACAMLGFFPANYSPPPSQASLVDDQSIPEAIRTLSAASQLCQSQAGMSFGEPLVVAFIDDYSTRFDERRNLFVVVMFASVQRPDTGIKEYRVHCHVIPEEVSANYFQSFAVKA